MTATIVWSIDWLQSSTQDISGFPEVVVTAGWRCNGTEEDQATSFYGTVSFLPPQEGDPNFTPYADLTQDQVLGWVWTSGVDKDATELAVQTRLTEQLNPAEVQLPLPWATPAV